MIRNMVSRKPIDVYAEIGAEQYRQLGGLLMSPNSRRSTDNIRQAIESGAPWAADNDMFAHWKNGTPFNSERFIRTLQDWQPYRYFCVFINAPDWPTDWQRTLYYFSLWQPVIKALGFPVSIAAQNGITMDSVPWDYIDALFIGCTDTWKYSPLMYQIVAEAKERGKWVHNGRVSWRTGIQRSIAMGCDSFDGTKFVRELANVGRVLKWQQQNVTTPTLQLPLWKLA